MDNYKIVAESYNAAIEAGFNSFLEKHATAENAEIKFDEEALIVQIEEKWLDTKLEQIGDITSAEYISSLSSLEEVINLFITIASVSDIGVPDILTDRLKEYGKPAADRLFEFAVNSLKSKNPDSYQAVPQAVYAIGCLKCEEYKQKLIELLIDTCHDDLISEAICAAIVEYDGDIVDNLIKTFNDIDRDIVREHLLSCIAEISKDNKSDEIFYFLKNAFRVVSNIKLAAEVIGDYGDGRAIPLLRGYILKNIRDMDKATFNHIRAVIKKLGGEINDLIYTD